MDLTGGGGCHELRRRVWKARTFDHPVEQAPQDDRRDVLVHGAQRSLTPVRPYALEQGDDEPVEEGSQGERQRRTQIPALGEYEPKLTRPPGQEEEGAASDWFEIEQGTPYTVPQGKLLVIRAFGTPSESGNLAFGPIRIKVNGTDALVAWHKSWEWILYGGGTTMTEVSRLFTVPAGSLVEIVADQPTTTDGQAWCYLAEE